MYSLWMARPLLYEGFVVLNCDVLFHPALLDDLLATHHETRCSSPIAKPSQPAFGDEEMKVKVRCGRVRRDVEDDGSRPRRTARTSAS